jgi:fatty acid desaturase
MTKDHSEAWSLVKDLHRPRPAIFWADLLLSAAAGWGSAAVVLLAKPFSASMLLAFPIALCALYRGLCFVHEISHMRRSQLRGFETAWNAILGVPLLMPSFTYVGVHTSHHSPATFGTDQDPEYLRFARSRWMTVAFVAHSVLIPLVLLLRFLVVSPVGLLSPRLHRWLAVHASSLSMNPLYRREVSPRLSTSMRRWETAILLAWLAAGALAWRYGLAWKAIAVWCGISSCVALCNALRALGAHRYESTGMPLDRAGQLLDSIDTPGALWTELWAPVGLRYHALHHYFPGIPYHHLGTAYRRLVECLPADAGYRELTSPSLGWSLRRLYRTAKTLQQSTPNDELCAQPPLRSPGN